MFKGRSRRQAPEGPPQIAGRAPRTPPDTRIYAVGDIHGRDDLLASLHARIEQHARDFGGRRVLVYVGDYVDRGPDSAGVIDRLVNNPLSGFETVHLAGNHEAFLLDFLENPQEGSIWMMNGGEATCESYGIDFWSLEGEDRFAALNAALKTKIPDSHRRFLDSLRLRHEEGDYLFVHAGIDPERPPDDQDDYDLMWIREPFLYSRRDFGRVVVHGHTPVDRPEERANRIDIDTGAVYGGRLTALVLQDETRDYIQV
jgi:serine/threonine protein phosphatase 1